VAVSTGASTFDAIASEAASESALWGGALRDAGAREQEHVFSPLGEAAHALAVETIYEGYLVHYGTPRLFAPADDDTALLLGDYLYAHGLVRLAASGGVPAVADLAALISLCAQLRADGAPGDGTAWAATASCLGDPRLRAARDALRDRGDRGPLLGLACQAAGDEAVGRALAVHALRASRPVR
jgi:hypothetical protein